MHPHGETPNFNPLCSIWINESRRWADSSPCVQWQSVTQRKAVLEANGATETRVGGFNDELMTKNENYLLEYFIFFLPFASHGHVEIRIWITHFWPRGLSLATFSCWPGAHECGVCSRRMWFMRLFEDENEVPQKTGMKPAWAMRQGGNGKRKLAFVSFLLPTFVITYQT